MWCKDQNRAGGDRWPAGWRGIAGVRAIRIALHSAVAAERTSGCNCRIRRQSVRVILLPCASGCGQLKAQGFRIRQDYSRVWWCPARPSAALRRCGMVTVPAGNRLTKTVFPPRERASLPFAAQGQAVRGDRQLELAAQASLQWQPVHSSADRIRSRALSVDAQPAGRGRRRTADPHP